MDLAEIGRVLVSPESRQYIWIIVGTLMIMGVAMRVSVYQWAITRFTYCVLVAGLAMAISIEYSGLTKDFFFNVSTELIGAMIVILLLGQPTADWQLMIIGMVVGSSIIPVFASTPEMRPLFINLSTELIGAFVILILLEKPYLLGGGRREQGRRKEFERYLLRQEVIRDREFDEWKQTREEEQNRIMRDKMKMWGRQLTDYDIMVKVNAADLDEARAKAEQLRERFSRVQIIAVTPETETGNCCAYIKARL